MVIQEDSDLPLEVPYVTETPFEVNQYVVVKNHMREIKRAVITENQYSDSSSQSSKQKEISKKSTKKRKRKHNGDLETQTSIENNENETTHSKITDAPVTISASDLEELKSVYKKCKAIVKKIETKYGHLLNTTDTEPHQPNYFSSEEEKCTCLVKKKIIYDDNGLEITKELVLDNHICPKKLKSSHRKVAERNIQIEYEGAETTLPEELQTLSNILQDPTLEITHRNKIVNKIKALKQENLNEIKFNKHSLIENIKSDPYKVLNFKGTNLEELKGYF